MTRRVWDPIKFSDDLDQFMGDGDVPEISDLTLYFLLCRQYNFSKCFFFYYTSFIHFPSCSLILRFLEYSSLSVYSIYKIDLLFFPSFIYIDSPFFFFLSHLHTSTIHFSSFIIHIVSLLFYLSFSYFEYCLSSISFSLSFSVFPFFSSRKEEGK